MFASVICVAIKGTVDAGGFVEVWDIAKQGNSLLRHFTFENDTNR